MAAGDRALGLALQGGGKLYYDADGTGPSAPQLIATLSGAPALTASDITVI